MRSPFSRIAVAIRERNRGGEIEGNTMTHPLFFPWRDGPPYRWWLRRVSVTGTVWVYGRRRKRVWIYRSVYDTQ
jgi:hypothetical protein